MSKESAYYSLLARFLKLWEGREEHYEAHYRAVAENSMTHHHCAMVRLLEEVRATLNSEGLKIPDGMIHIGWQNPIDKGFCHTHQKGAGNCSSYTIPVFAKLREPGATC